MQRNEWKFNFTAKDMFEASAKKVALHSERVDHWTAKRNEAEQRLRTEGIDFRQAANAMSTTAGYSASNSLRPQPVFDNELLSAFNEAQAKVSEHEARHRDYSAYARAFELLVIRGEPATFPLNADDVQYFGL